MPIVFVQVRWNVNTLFFSNLMLDIIEDYIPHCVKKSMSNIEAIIAALH